MKNVFSSEYKFKIDILAFLAFINEKLIIFYFMIIIRIIIKNIMK